MRAYLPPPADFAQGPSFGGPTTDASHYTPWFTRVLAYVIDSIPVYLLAIIGGVVLYAFQQVETICVAIGVRDYCATGDNGPSTTAWIIFSVCVLIAIVFWLWNFVVRQGNTGSSIGKQMMKFKVVGEQTQQPIGVLKSLLRQIAHGIDAAHLLHRIPVPAVGCQASDDCRQAHEDRLRTAVDRCT